MPLFPPTLVYGEAGVGAVTLLSLLLISGLSKSIHILTVFGVRFVLGDGAGPRGQGRGRQLFPQLAVIRLQRPLPTP